MHESGDNLTKRYIVYLYMYVSDKSCGNEATCTYYSNCVVCVSEHYVYISQIETCVIHVYKSSANTHCYYTCTYIPTFFLRMEMKPGHTGNVLLQFITRTHTHTHTHTTNL